MDKIDLRPIGIVHCETVNSMEMLKHGTEASIEIYPEFLAGLQGIERSSHIMVVGWLHRAERNILQVHRPRYVDADLMRGVFACRTPVRPNPIGVTTVRLVKIEGNVLHVDGLDMADGTPVVDIKPHAPGFDSAFCARSARDLSRLADPDASYALRGMLREAENFHGERCAGLIVGAKMIYRVMKTLAIAQKDPRLRICVGKDGCIADAIQVLSGATFGNNRLKWAESPSFVFSYDNLDLKFSPRKPDIKQMEDILAMDIEELCAIETPVLSHNT